MAEIVVVVPVLGRPQNAAPLVESFAAASSVSRLRFVCSPGDDEQIAASFFAIRQINGEMTVVDWEPGPGDFARKMNLAYRETSEPWIFQAADDVRFSPGWDRALLACAEKTGALVIGSQDGHNPSVKAGRHSTHTLVARFYADDPGASLDGPGTLFSEAYDHQYCDLELCELARARGVWAFCEEALVEHLHPFWIPDVASDGTYRKGQARSREDARLYARRMRGVARAARVR